MVDVRRQRTLRRGLQVLDFRGHLHDNSDSGKLFAWGLEWHGTARDTHRDAGLSNSKAILLNGRCILHILWQASLRVRSRTEKANEI